MTAPAVGIDLGTTYSCVAVCRGGKVDIIPNPNGNRTTPSVVSFGNHRLVGDDAIDEGTLENSENTVFDVKRLIGRNFDDPTVQRDREHWPFSVVNEEGRPKIKITYRGEVKTYFPEEISSMVLNYMKTSAEKYLGKTVRNAVVTVPAYFNDSQRQATKDAATIAGLHVLRIINEPTAGALAYGLENTDDEERNVLIYDLGGGTFDVSILAIEDGIFEVRSTAGNTHLGGADFDTKMVDHFVEEFQRRFSINLKAGNYKRELRRLRTACEKAKRKLSSAEEASIALDGMAGQDFHTTISRARFEELCGEMFKATLNCVKEALQEADLKKDEISDVVLVGGSTRIPVVQKLLREFFNGKQLNNSVNPDEAVALGAAIQAANLDGELSDTVMDLVLLDVTPLSLGTDVAGGATSVIIPRNTTIPTRKTVQYTTSADYQTEVNVDVLEGERYLIKDNNLLGKFKLTGITKAPRGVPKIQVTFDIDANGILHATAVDLSSKSRNDITIVNEKGRLSKKDIDRMVREAERFEREDEMRKEAMKAKNDLEDFCYKMKNRAWNNYSASNRIQVLSRCDAVISWLKGNPEASKSVCEQKKRELVLVLEMLMMEL